MKNSTAIGLLHFIVMLWGFTSVLGVLITYDSFSLVWWRLLVTVISLLIFMILTKKHLKLKKRLFLQIAAIGLLVAVHWLVLYGGFKVSNISITMIAFSSTTFFTALIEPIFYQRKVNKSEVLIGIGIFLTISIIAINEIENTPNALLGFTMGILAALTGSLFSSINGILIQQSDSFTITFIELTTAFIAVSLVLFVFLDPPHTIFSPSSSNLIYLLLLGVVCTAVPFLISVEIMKKLTPFTVNLTINLEIIYAILLAYFIFGNAEKMTPTFYLGSILIICLILANEMVKKRKIKHQQTLN